MGAKDMTVTILATLLVLPLAGCPTTFTQAPADTAPVSEAAAWCALGFYGPGMAGWCDEKETNQ